MITWHIGTKSELSVDKKTDDKIDYRSKWYRGDEHGTQENETIITAHKDGSVSMFELDRDGYVFLYPEQVEHLREILRNMEAI